MKAPFPWFVVILTMALLPDNVLSKIHSMPEVGCWLWTAATTNGYGVVQINGKLQRAHRVVYEALIGKIPEGLEIDHLCRNRSCVNPAHMEPVTGRENIARGESKSAIHSRQTHCKAGHEFTPENTYLRKRGHKTERFCRECCRARDRRRRPAMGVKEC